MKKSKVYLTKEGFEEIKKEYKNLVDVERSKIAERIKSAREMGDISENAEYESARERQAFLEGRISELESILSDYKIIDEKKAKIAADFISIGAMVKVECDGEVDKFKIVGSVEANPIKNLISNESPVGQALLGSKVGDVIEVTTPVVKLKYKILEVFYE